MNDDASHHPRGPRAGPPQAGPRPLGGPSAVPGGRGVPSPCVNVCRMNLRTGWCEGCLRTIDEIAAWATLDDEAKRAVWALLPARREAFAMSGPSE